MSEVPSVCWVCLGEAPDEVGGRYHRACLMTLFGVEQTPSVSFSGRDVAAWADEHADKISIGGIQPKGLAALSDDNGLVLVERDSTHIVKPPQDKRRYIVQNEHLTMRLATLAGLDVAARGLIELRDGAVAYVTRRFDRRPRVPVVDFCQLADLLPEDKIESTTEECAALVREHAAPGTALALFRLFLFSYWVRNGDLHLKNLMLIERPQGDYVMSPAYDLLSTQPYEGSHWNMQLPLRGRKRNLARRLWVDFAVDDCGLTRSEGEAEIDSLLARLPEAAALVQRSLCPSQGWKNDYVRGLEKRTRELAG